MESGAFFNRWMITSKIDLTAIEDIPRKYQQQDYDITCFKSIAIMIYTMLFATLISGLNIKKMKNRVLGNTNLIINGIILLFVIPQGFYLLGILRESYIEQIAAEYYSRSSFHIIIRYIFIAFIGLLLGVSFKYIRQKFLEMNYRIVVDLAISISILVIASTELIQWLELSNSADSYKLGLSILWGIFAVSLIVLGIWKRKKHFRIGAIVLFGGTLLKLFTYDLTQLDTISKTIVFIVIGIFLLISSFLYLKYRNVLFGTDEKGPLDEIAG